MKELKNHNLLPKRQSILPRAREFVLTWYLLVSALKKMQAKLLIKQIETMPWSYQELVT